MLYESYKIKSFFYTGDLHNCLFNLEPLVFGNFVLETVGDLESKLDLAGTGCLLSGLQQ